jgi:peroxiredoxin
MPAEDDVKQMTEAELRSHLITHDYKGVKFKTLALDELLRRASAVNNIKPDVAYNKSVHQWSSSSTQ